MEQRQREDGPAPVLEPAADAVRSVLDEIEVPAPEANVMLASGRRYELTAGTEADRVTIRSRTGEVVLRIEVTDAGPVLSFSGASVELVAARSLRLAADDVSIEAGRDVSVTAGGSLRQRVAGDHHLSVAGDERVEAANVQLQANAGGVSVRAAQTIALDGEHIGLNDDPPPAPFAWSAIAEP